ncbi:glycosyltransferase [Mucilaginibacter endophyticus]|uniref:glycosyltransferase n=1 Tax=Mucilaginibacter endophyticus TaxID=2675003 RepID=UPI000E0DD37F|nr:glycosyltransferase [Mucilaginibacter endophyticus]
MKGKKILFACVPADGHFKPLSKVAKYYMDCGADVRWLVSDIYAAELAKLGIRHYPLVKTLDINANNIADLVPEIRTNDHLRRMTLYRIQYAKRSIEYYHDIKAIRDSFQFDLMIVDSLFPAIPFIKPLLQVPVVAIGVVPLAENSIDTAPYGLGLLPPKNDPERTLYKRLYQEMPNKTQEATEIFAELLQQEGIPYGGLTIENTLIKAADLYLQIGVPEFEYYRSDLGNNIKFIGSLLNIQSDKNDSWHDDRLKSYKKVALVTQGTVEGDSTKLLEPTIAAFMNTDILLIVTTGGKSTMRLREMYLAPNVIVEDYIPFNQIMKHVDVYITNGGYGGATLSIMHRVPMITAGLHEGKNEICARVEHFGIGINLNTEHPAPERIREAFDEIAKSNNYKNKISALADIYERYDSLKVIDHYVYPLLNIKDPS